MPCLLSVRPFVSDELFENHVLEKFLKSYDIEAMTELLTFKWQQFQISPLKENIEFWFQLQLGFFLEV